MAESIPASLDLKDAWKEFPSIENANQANDDSWVALEKIHGANFCVCVSANSMSCARRTAVLDPAETFYDWQQVVKRYSASFKLAFEVCAGKFESLESISVYGELFGGVYPHPDVQDLGFQSVQKGVYYTNVIDFRAFDVELRYAASKDWMNYDEAMTMMQQVGIPYCVPLRRGTLMECFGFDIQINSTIPKSLGLPALQKNQMEGIVIKSINNYTIPGKRPEYRLRAIFKKKNSKFEEVNPPISSTLYEQRRDDERAAEREIFDNLERYVRNENRVETVESKFGPLTKDNYKEIGEELGADGLKDYIKDFEEHWAKLPEKVQERVTKSSKSMAGAFVLQTLKKREGD